MINQHQINQEEMENRMLEYNNQIRKVDSEDLENDPSIDNLSDWEQDLLDHYRYADKVGDALFCISVIVTVPFVIYGVFFNYYSLWVTCLFYGPLDMVLWIVMFACWEDAGTTPDIRDGDNKNE